ncbi:MAG: hypothetical protein U5K29_08640 [Acidimicrobiales bacterium]|nr:hypothetical protein [Acidimicrobiales bacterium]
MLGYSGFGLAALSIGMLADAIGLPATMLGMGTVIVVTMCGFAMGHRTVSARSAVSAAEIGATGWWRARQAPPRTEPSR